MMIRLLIALMLVCSVGFADIENPLIITEEDTSPLVVPYALKFTNGTVTDNGDGTASINVTGGSGAPTTADYLVGTTNGSLSAEIVVGTSPGGELGGTWASPTLDDGVAVSSWNLTTPTITTSLTTSTPTTITAAELDRLDGLAGAIVTTSAGNAPTATSLSANGTNCSAGEAPRGVDASGNSENCTTYLTGNQTVTLSGDVTGSGATSITATLDSDMKKGQFGVTLDGGGSAITTGIKGYVTIPYAMTITGWDILADTSGSIVVDVWKDTYANYPPTVADTIAGTEKPTLSTATKNQDASLSTWTTSVTAGDIIGFKVDSATTVTRVHVIIYGSKT